MGNRIHESQRDPLTGYPVFTSYVAYFENIGAATATDIDVDFFFYEESGY